MAGVSNEVPPRFAVMVLLSYRSPRATLAALLVIATACADSSGPDGEAKVATDVALPTLGAASTVALASVSVQDSAGAPVAGMSVMAGVVRARDATSLYPCDDPATLLLSFVQMSTDASGIATLQVPAAESGERAECIMVLAQLSDNTARIGEPLIARTGLRYLAIPARGSDTVRASLTSHRVTSGAGPRSAEDQWAELATGDVPGLAGWYYESCTMVVRVKKPVANGERARAWAMALPRMPNDCGATRRLEVRAADFDYAELRRWHDRLFVTWSLQGIRSVGIDRVRNRITYLVVGDTALRRLARAVSSLGVPAAAVVVDVFRPRPQPPFGPVVERWGTRLASGYWPRSPPWTADSRELVFLDFAGGTGRQTIRAITVPGNDVRTLGSVAGRNTGRSELRLSDDGRYLFTGVISPDDGLVVVHRTPVEGGEPVEIVRSLNRSWFAATSDGNRVAATWRTGSGSASEEVFGVIQPATGRRIIIGPGSSNTVAHAFSPDGNRLLFSFDGVREFWIRDSVDVPLVPNLPFSEHQRVLDVRWIGDEPVILLAERNSERNNIVRVSPRTGTRRVLGSVPAGARIVTSASWLAEDGPLAVWLPLRSTPYVCPGPSCLDILQTLTHWQLHVIESGQTGSRVVAEMATLSGAPSVSLSPDGKWAAHTQEIGLYIVPLR